MSSSVVFSFMYFQKASVASAILVSWQTPAAPTNSLESASPFKLRNRSSPLSRLTFVSATQHSPATASISVRSAEVICPRSVPGRAGRPCHDRQRLRTPHDTSNPIPCTPFCRPSRHTLGGGADAQPSAPASSPGCHQPTPDPLAKIEKQPLSSFSSFTTKLPHRPRHPLTSCPNFNAHSHR